MTCTKSSNALSMHQSWLGNWNLEVTSKGYFMSCNWFVYDRDLKLQNILMDEEGHLKITDFGVSVQNTWLGKKIQEDCKTGTPSFMAPEVSLMSSLTNVKLLEIIASDLGYWLKTDKLWIAPHSFQC